MQASLVALIHNSNGDIVGKVSRDLSREVSGTDPSGAGNDRILYAESVELPKGHYVVDTAMTDELAGKTTVKRVALFVDPQTNLGMSFTGDGAGSATARGTAQSSGIRLK